MARREDLGVIFNNPDTKVDDMAVQCTDSLLHCGVRLKQLFIIAESFK